MRLNDYYKDRGMKKFMGFYLSEHTSTQQEETKQKNITYLPKRQMSEEEIFNMLGHAILKNFQVSIQLNERSFDSNSFLENITGHINGYSEDLLFLGDASLPIESIRHVSIVNNKIWYK